jgi:hypothetical protein
MKKSRGCEEYIFTLTNGIKGANQLLKACAVSNYPVKLEPLARYQGIKEIREEETGIDGQLFKLASGGYRLILNQRAPRARKRFTIAHEIAHTLLPPNEEGAEYNCSNKLIEEICDIVASQILVPIQLLDKVVSTSSDTLSIASFFKISKLFVCSLRAAACALLNSGSRRGALIIGKRKSSGSNVLEVVSTSYSWNLTLPFIGLSEIRPQESFWTAKSGFTEIGDFFGDIRYPAEYARFGKTVFILVRIGFRNKTDHTDGKLTGMTDSISKRQLRLF